jgi:flagellar biosynthetic protein FlhB
MADEQDDTEKTEDPTQKRLDDAVKRGDVVKSQEVNTWFVIGGATLAVAAFSGPMASSLTTSFRGLIANAHEVSIDHGGLMHLAQKLGMDVMAAAALPTLVLVLAAIGGNVIQHRLVWSAEQLKPKFSKISPLAGAKRLFSKVALVNFAKGLIKLTILGAIMVWLLWPERHRLDTLVTMEPVALMGLTEVLSVKLLGTTAAVLALVAALDYLFQYRQWFERQKMSLREIKDEFKQTEGDPVIKGKMRQVRQNRMRKRMMAAVPKASVVITNPTHFAVALQYERGMNAPICVAKGIDSLALKIKEIARDHGIPVIENPPLARALHATVEIDGEVKPEQYKAVAEVIGYVMRLRRGFRR